MSSGKADIRERMRCAEEAAVKSYQTQHALVGDGVVGPRTWWAPAGAAGVTLASLSELATV